MSLVVLWTDALVFLLLVFILAGVFSLRKNRQVKEQWQSVFKSRVGSAAAVILMLYVVNSLVF